MKLKLIVGLGFLFFSFLSQAHEIKILSYNIWGLHPFIVPVPKSRLGVICQELKNWDKKQRPMVVMLQEVWYLSAQKNLAGCGYQNIIRTDWKNNQTGLVMLTDLPILEKGTLIFDDELESYTEIFADKGLQYFKTKIEGESVWFFNTHLAENTPRFHQLRKAQYLELKNFAFEKTSKLQELGIFGGDYNMGTTAPIGADSWEDYLSFVFPLSGFVASEEESKDLCTYCPGNSHVSQNSLPLQLDHILVGAKKDAEVISLEQAFTKLFNVSGTQMHLSDHFGVLGIVHWN